MKVTRRFRASAALAALFALGAVVLARPLLLAGTASIGAWLLARQVRFARDAVETADGLTVRQKPARTIVAADETVTVTLSASLAEPSPGDLTVEASPPVGTGGSDESDRTIVVPTGEQAATTTFTLTCPVAGRHTFDRAEITLADSDGLFESRQRAGTAPTITVEPRTPREIHVGEGGELATGAFGEHSTGEQGAGLVPAELREYVAGDPADSIDWKATARLREPHVRQYDVEVDLETALVVDHRATMGDGRAGRTKLDYGRQVALSYLAATRRGGEAIGLYAVGDEGVTAREPPASDDAHYATLRVRLHDLDPTATRDRRRIQPQSPADARRSERLLAGDRSAFGRALRPFFAGRKRYVDRIEADPLARTTRSELRSLSESVVTVLVTDDERPSEVRETVELARRGDDRVVLFLLPSVLFEPGGLADLEDAYRRYVEFEEFRRSLAGRSRVSAFEVAPQDRIAAVLSAGRRRSRA
jgi:uncharacterized protein (DUF58 family)